MSGVRGHVRVRDHVRKVENHVREVETMACRFFGLTGHVRVRGHVREVETMSERSRPCQKIPWLVGKRFFGLRASFTLEGKTRPQLY